MRDGKKTEAKAGGSSPLAVAAVTFADGGDDFDVYAQVSATTDVGGMT
ncbi:hypothetical protein ACSLFT_33865 (plasmid) [Streptomyces sp. G6]